MGGYEEDPKEHLQEEASSPMFKATCPSAAWLNPSTRMIAIRPPEYFPRCVSLGLLAQVDHFILADTFQYSRQSFQNRSKLRNPNGWQWISIPLAAHQHGRPIRTVEIDTDTRWQEKHWRAFMYNYRSTMYFEYFEEQFAPFFETTWTQLGACTCRSVDVTAALFDLDVTITRASELPGAPDTLAAIHDAVGGGPLLSPSEAAPHDAEVVSDVRVYQFEHPTYRQNFEGFETDMAALDLLFNGGPQSLRTIFEAARIEAHAS